MSMPIVVFVATEIRECRKMLYHTHTHRYQQTYSGGQ